MQAQGAQAGDGDAGRSLGLVLETTDHGAAREPSLAGAEAAQARVAKYGLRTPLLKANIGDDGGGMEVLLKAENLQPIRSYKVRGASNAILALLETRAEQLAEHGVFTASAGNFSQGILFVTRRLGLRCTVLVPDHTPPAKLEAMRRLDPDVVVLRCPFQDWFAFLMSEGRTLPPQLAGNAAVRGCFVSPITCVDVMDGNGTMALEILEQLGGAAASADVDAVLVPWGGGAMAVGIATVLREKAPGLPVYACEVSTAAPVGPSLAAGRPVQVPYTPSFVDGIGGLTVADAMWPRARDLLTGALSATPDDIADAVRLLVSRNCLVAEGAGAAAMAVALK